jgi:hypothetical protein
LSTSQISRLRSPRSDPNLSSGSTPNRQTTLPDLGIAWAAWMPRPYSSHSSVPSHTATRHTAPEPRCQTFGWSKLPDGPTVVPKRVVTHQDLELADQIGAAAGGQIGLDPGLQGGEELLFQPHRLRGQAGMRPHARQRTTFGPGPPPQPSVGNAGSVRVGRRQDDLHRSFATGETVDSARVDGLSGSSWLPP